MSMFRNCATTYLDELHVMGTLSKEVFHCFSCYASLVVGVWSHSGFEGFVIEYLECSFSCFGSERRKAKEWIGFVECSLAMANIYDICYS